MSQLFDYFACSRPIIEQWAEALADGDEERRAEIEATMPRVARLKGIGQDEFNILAACAAGEAVDVVKAAGRVDLVRVIDAEEGPWVMAFRRPEVEAVAGMRVDGPLLGRWARHAAELHGRPEGRNRMLLSEEAAETFQEMCVLAVKGDFGLFVCFYG